MKRALALAVLATATLLVMAIPAMAGEKMITVDGYDDCDQGSSVIHWTVTNTSDGNIRLTDSSRPTVVAPDALIGANMGDYFTETLAPGLPSPQSLTVSWLDANDGTQTATATVDLVSDCTPTPTTPPPTSPPPTTVPPTTTPPTHGAPSPTTFTPPIDLAMTGANTGHLLPVIGLLAVAGLVLSAVARYTGKGRGF